MAQVVDDVGRAHDVGSPRRLVSLVPSTTETVCALGLADRLVGVTRFCIHPAEVVAGLPRVGGTKDVDIERVRALAPDLVLANAEENTRDVVEALQDVVPTYVAMPRTVDDAVHDLRRLGRLLDAADAAEAIARDAEAALAALDATSPSRCAYLIWREPWMTVNGDTYVHDVMARFGLANAFADRADRYPTVSLDELVAADLDLVLLSSEPFPFRTRHVDELVAAGVPRERVRFVDGEAFTWHGARMRHAFAHLADARRAGFATEPVR